MPVTSIPKIIKRNSWREDCPPYHKNGNESSGVSNANSTTTNANSTTTNANSTTTTEADAIESVGHFEGDDGCCDVAKTSMFQRLTEILDQCEAQFTCSVCSDLMNHPATVACGHTFCAGCIQDWFQNKENCPVCRESCHGGETTDPVVPIGDFEATAKPLIYFRQNHSNNTNSRSNSSPTSSSNANAHSPIPGDGRKFTPDQDAKLLDYLSSRVLNMKSEHEYKSLDAALNLVRCALATGTSLDEILDDFAHLSESPTNLNSTIDKYLTHSSLSDENYFYEPLSRKRRISLHWPTIRSIGQMGALAFISFVSYHALAGLETEGFAIFAEPLLRAISLMDVYIGLFDHFR